MRRIRLAVASVVLAASSALAAFPESSGPSPAAAARGRFQLAILAQDWHELGDHYDWEGIGPRLQAATVAPLLVIDEHDVEAYDWAAQRIVLRPEATPRFLRALQTLRPEDKRLSKLKALWNSLDLLPLELRGFLVSFDGRPLYGGIFSEKSSQMSIHYPVIHTAVDEERRIVLRFSPILYTFGSLWDDGTSGDALDSPSGLYVEELQEDFRQAFPNVRTPNDYLSPEDQELVARFKRRILDSRVRALFTQLGVPAQAPRRRQGESARGPGGPAAAQPLVVLNPWLNRNWEIGVALGDPESVAEVRYRSSDEKVWHSILHDDQGISLQARPQWLTPGRHRIEVKLVDFAGVESAPYAYDFDPEQERLLLGKLELRQALYRWAEFGKGSRCDGPCLDFSTALFHREVLREIRYSLGDCTLERRFPFEPWTDITQPANLHGQETTVPVAPEVSRACVQLVYRDGEETEPQVYDRLPLPENAWRLAGASQSAAPPAASPQARPGSPSPVSLRALRSGTGWEVVFDLGNPESLSDILYRFDGEGKWLSTGLYPMRSPRTGRYHPNTIAPVSPRTATPGRHRLEVRLVGLDGREKGPYNLGLDLQQQVLAEAKSELNDPKTDFAKFDDTGSVLYFSGLIDHRDALAEIRFSVDSRALDQRLPFTLWDDLSRAPAPDGDSYRHFSKPVSYACFQLVYRDGETAAPRCVFRQGEKSVGKERRMSAIPR